MCCTAVHPSAFASFHRRHSITTCAGGFGEVHGTLYDSASQSVEWVHADPMSWPTSGVPHAHVTVKYLQVLQLGSPNTIIPSTISQGLHLEKYVIGGLHANLVVQTILNLARRHDNPYRLHSTLDLRQPSGQTTQAVENIDSARVARDRQCGAACTLLELLHAGRATVTTMWSTCLEVTCGSGCAPFSWK